MPKIRIFFAYKHIDGPWGGANNFNRALFNELNKNPDFTVHHDQNSPSDILFFSQLSRGPGNASQERKRRYRLSQIKELKIKSGAKLVVRAVNLNINSDQPGIFGLMRYVIDGFWRDMNTIRLVNLADYVIFQSEFQKSFFRRWGYSGKNDTVIHNGAPAVFKNNNYSLGYCHNPLRLVSNSNFKTFKRHDIIARMSLLPGVKITHLGNWSHKLKKHKVDVKGILTHEEIVEIYKNSDYLLHSAVNDPCPNSVVEALYFGLPVIYNNKGGGSRELVRNNGLPLIENNLEKTIELAKKHFISFKKRLSINRDHYSIDRTVSDYVNIFNQYGK